MIQIKVIRNIDEVNARLPQCHELAQRVGSTLPFHQLEMPLLWWKHFGGDKSIDFGQLRGRNFWGLQSWIEEFCLLIAEDEDGICGVVPLVSIVAKMGRNSPNVRLLTFAGDSVLIAYQDLLVAPKNQQEVITTLLDAMVKLTQENHDLLFLGYVPESSPNLPGLRHALTLHLQNGWLGGETLNQRRGGVYPWTVAALLSSCRKLQTILGTTHSAQPDLTDLITKLERLAPEALLFSRTRLTLEAQIKGIVERLRDEREAQPEINVVIQLLTPLIIPYPYIKLPRDRESYLKSLSRETRRYFRRYGERFKEEGGFFEKIDSLKLTNQDIDDYLNLHAVRWQSDSAAVNDMTLGFHRELTLNMVKTGQFCLFFANHKGRRIATHSCFDINARREGYFTGRDPTADEVRAGRLLYLETILDAIEKGFTVYDLGYGGDAYKMSFADAAANVSHFVLAPNGRMPDLEKLFSKYEYVALA